MRSPGRRIVHSRETGMSILDMSLVAGVIVLIVLIVARKKR